MIYEASAMDVRKNFDELLNQIKYCHNNILIRKAGKPVAALIDVDLFEKITSLKSQFHQLTLELSQAYSKDEQEFAQQDICQALTEIQTT